MLDQIVYGHVTILDIILSVVILFAGFGIAKLLSIYLRRILKDKVSEDHLQVIIKTVHYSVIIAAIIIIMPLLGMKISGILVAGGVAGIVIGFASQNIVSNLISGIFLMIERPIKIGNAVNIDGSAGIVEDIHILSTIIRTYDGLYVRIPNIKVFTTTLINYVANIARRIDYIIGIRYSDDAEKAVAVIKEVLTNNPFVLLNPAPIVFVESLGDNAVNIAIRFWAPASIWYDVKMELLWRLKISLEAENIQVPFPQRVIWHGREKNDLQ
ncbi:mechanosensitive ion channel family protein [bacterium]|nr:mechanosensitive ion channel family protein [candidate division CSSED10-310 bacterium]